MSCTTFNKVGRSETKLEGVDAAKAPPRSSRARVDNAKEEATDKKDTNPGGKKNCDVRRQLLARVLTSRRSLFKDARFLMDGQPKMHNARWKLQLGFSIVFLAVHRQNLIRQVCQIFMQAGQERKRREALEAGKPIPTSMQNRQAPLETTAKPEVPKVKYSSRLADSLRSIMEARAWMNRTEEKKKAAIQQRSLVAEIACQAEQLQGTLAENLDGFVEMGQHIQDQLAIANALQGDVHDAVRMLQQRREQRQQQREMDHQERVETKSDAAAAAAKVRDAVRKAEEMHRRSQEEARRREEQADVFVRLAEEEHERALKAFEAAQKQKEEVTNQLESVRQVTTVDEAPKMRWEDTIESDPRDASIKNWADNLVGAHIEKGSIAYDSAVGACNNTLSAAGDEDGSCTDASGNAAGVADSTATGAAKILSFARTRVAESASSATPVAGHASASSANADEPTVAIDDIVTAAAESRPSSTSSHGLALVSSRNSTSLTSAAAVVSSGLINVEAEDAGQTVAGTPAAAETQAAIGLKAAVGAPVTINCAEIVAHHSGVVKVTQHTLVDGFDQEAVAKRESSTAALGVADGNAPSCTPPSVASVIPTEGCSSRPPMSTADDIAGDNAPIRPSPSEPKGIANDRTSSCMPPPMADGIVDASSGQRSPVTADGVSSHKHTAVTGDTRIPDVSAPLLQSAGEESSLDGLSTDADLHLESREHDAEGSNFSTSVASMADSSATDSNISTDHHEGSGMQAVVLAESDDGCLDSPAQVRVAPRKAASSRRRPTHGFDKFPKGSLEASLVASRPDRRCLQATGVASLEQPECVLSVAADEGRRAVSKPSHLDGANVRNLDLPDPPSTTVAATVGAEGSRALSKLSHHDVDCLSETVEGDWPIRVGCRNPDIEVPGAKELTPNIAGSSLESGGDSFTARPSSMAVSESQQQIRGGFANRARRVMEATTTAETLQAEDLTHCTLSKPSNATMTTEDFTHRILGKPSSANTLTEDLTYCGLSKPFSSKSATEAMEHQHQNLMSYRTFSKPSSTQLTTGIGVEACAVAGPVLESFPSSPDPGQEDTENAVVMLTTHRLLSNSSSAREAMETGRGKDALLSGPAPVRDPLTSIRRFGSKSRCDSNVTAAAHETLAAIKGAEELSGRTVPRRSKGSNYCSLEDLDQMPFVSEGADRSPPRRPSKRAYSKRASATNFIGVQDTWRQRRDSKSKVMRDARADQGAPTGFPPVECLSIAHGVDIPNHPSQGPLAAGPRRSSKAMITGPILPLNILGQRVVQPKILSSRSASKTDSSAFPTPRTRSKHVPQLEDLVIFGDNNEAGTLTERRTRSKLHANPSAQASGVAPDDVLPRRRRAMTDPPKIIKGYAQHALKAHVALQGAACCQHAGSTFLTLNSNFLRHGPSEQPSQFSNSDRLPSKVVGLQEQCACVPGSGSGHTSGRMASCLLQLLNNN